MLLKDWYNLQEPVDNQEDISNATLYRLLEIFCKMNGTTSKSGIKFPNIYSQLVKISKDSARQYGNLLIDDEVDILKYYYLDKLTNGCYVKALLSQVYAAYQSNVQFVFDFKLNNFYEYVGQPTIELTFQEMSKGGNVNLRGVVYRNAFNGTENLVEALCIMTDTLGILSPNYVNILLAKLLSGKKEIVQSMNHIIQLKTVFQSFEDVEKVQPIDNLCIQPYYPKGVVVFKSIGDCYERNLESYQKETIKNFLGGR